MTLELRISKLEDQKWDLILQGASENSVMQAKIKSIDKKLNKLYAWLSKGYMAGMEINSEVFC